MKKLIALLTFCSVVISGVLIYLVLNGISLRSAPIIKPSIMTSDQKNVAEAVILRLFPDLQGAEYVVIGLRAELTESQQLLNLLKSEYEKQFGREISILPDAAAVTQLEFQSCRTPCWILTTQDKSNELTENPLLSQWLPAGSQRPYFNLTLIPFSSDAVVTDFCIEEKRLTLDCLIPLSIHEAKRKMKDPLQRYFFVRKYNERDYFLFTQEPRS